MKTPVRLPNLIEFVALAVGLSVAISVLAPIQARGSDDEAEGKMDAATHTLVIDKLEGVLAKGKEDETLNMRPIRARLADLYSERARLRAMSEAEKGCDSCEGSREDRAKALALYSKVVRDGAPSDEGTLLMQKAHLHEMQGEIAKASVIYDSVISGQGSKSTKTKYGKDIQFQALMGRGELRFGKGEFGKAKPDFEAAMRLAAPERRGYALYRIAWCELNQGNQPKATSSLVKLLRSPDLLTRPSTNGLQFDASFQEDVSRDLASFLARGVVGRREIALLVSVSPEAAKRENIRYLATESERLGARAAALVAWDAFIESKAPPVAGKAESKSDDRLEAMVHVAQIRYELGHKDDALKTMRLAAAHWNQMGCSVDPAECELMRTHFRKIAIDWNRAEKKKPTAQLLAAYKAYLIKFDQDAEMTHWAALVAREIKSSKEAASLFHKASLLAAEALHGGKSVDGTGKPASEKDLASSRDILEASLVGGIETAELSKDAALREAAYGHYLVMNPSGDKAIEVRYQRARMPYETGSNIAASVRLFDFATSQQCRNLAVGQPSDKGRPFKRDDADLCVKAADLDLDALAQAKQDPQIEVHAKQFATVYPARRAEYAEIARKSTLNQVSKTSNDGKADDGDVKGALAKLNSVSLVGATAPDQIAYWKNRLKLAERARDVAEADRSASGLLTVKGLSKEDQEYALSQKEWAAEMQLDFASAYKISLKMDMPKLSVEDRLLRLALLAELAGRSPRVHQEQFLRIVQNRKQYRDQALAIRAKIVRDSQNPLAEMHRQGRDLEISPSIYAPLALEIFARTQNYAFAEQALKVRGVAQQPAGQALGRSIFLRDFSRLQAMISVHRIRSSSDALMMRTLGERIKLLGKAEEFAGKAVRSRDWTLQLATLATLSTENERLHDDIMRLPVPRRLRGADRARYITLISSKARPYQDKHIQIETKLSTFWSDSKSLEEATRAYESSRRELRPLIAKDIQAIAHVAPPGVSRRLKSAIAVNTHPLAKDVSIARNDVQRSPFNARSLQRLRLLEEQSGKDSMVAYLDARLAQLNQGEKK